MKIAVARLLLLTLLSLTMISWGFYGHRMINRYAVFSLPPEMIGFYKTHIEFLTQHAVDPDKRRYVSENEAVKHYIDLDHYGFSKEEVFDSIPTSWRDAVEKFSEDTLKTYGILPWNIVWVHNRLTQAFKEKDCQRILNLSADLGHYIADAHVPLHTTENYNGQLTGQKGIHALWESRVPELEATEYDLLCGKAEYIYRPLELAWKIIRESHLLVDSVLQLELDCTRELGETQKYSIERRGNSISKNYSMKYSKEYSLRMNGMVEKRVRKAIKRVADLWFTAWVNAGQPDINKLLLGKYEVNDSLEKASYLQIIKGRLHDN